MTVAREATASLDLRDPPQRLRVEHVGRAKQFGEIRLERVVVDRVQILGPELVDGGTQRAHASDGTEHPFAGL
jgi:hypothetical protein